MNSYPVSFQNVFVKEEVREEEIADSSLREITTNPQPASFQNVFIKEEVIISDDSSETTNEGPPHIKKEINCDFNGSYNIKLENREDARIHSEAPNEGHPRTKKEISCDFNGGYVNSGNNEESKIPVLDLNICEGSSYSQPYQNDSQLQPTLTQKSGDEAIKPNRRGRPRKKPDDGTAPKRARANTGNESNGKKSEYAINKSCSYKELLTSQGVNLPYLNKIFECNSCNKTFTSSSHLRRHENIHKGVMRYECGTCKKQFVDRSNFKRHERIHTEEAQQERELKKKPKKKLILCFS